MTKEQIAAMIAAKIAGQGSMVDIGGALPEILTALAENGISTDMTVTEQMQARKDLGLYYEETTTVEKEAQYAGQEHGAYDPYVKISDDTPAADAIVALLGSDGEEREFRIDEESSRFTIVAVSSESPIFVVALVDGEPGFPTKGIYYQVSSISPGYDWKLVYNGETTVISKVPDKFLPEQSAGVVYAEVTAVPYPGMSLSEFTAAGFTEAVMRGFADHTIAGFVVNYGAGETSVFPVSHAALSYMDGYAMYGFSFLANNTQRNVSAQPGMHDLYISDAQNSDPNAVHFTQQPLTDTQKNQARKNLGLYYEQFGIDEKTARYTDETESVNLPGFYLISDDTPKKEDLTSMIIGEDEFTDLIVRDRGDEDGYTVESDTYVLGFIVIRSEAAGNTPGIYVEASVKDTAELNYFGPVVTEISKIPERFLPEQESVGPVTLSALPTASMTTQAELDAIGLTDTIIGGIINGNYTGIKFTDTSVLTNIKTAFAQFKTAQRVGGTAADTTLVFDMLGNNYNILVHSVVGNPPTVTVTVTPLT